MVQAFQSFLPSVEPSGVPARSSDYFRIDVPAEAFGAGTARATEQLGGQVERSSEQLSQAGLAYAGLRNETLAKEADIKLGATLTDMQYNPETGFYTKRGKDAVDGYQGVYD